MGRVYDALRRANAASAARAAAEEEQSAQKERNDGSDAQASSGQGSPFSNQIVEHPWDHSSTFSPQGVSPNGSASTAHTEELSGSALPGVLASRAAGATLDAAGSPRAGEFVTEDIFAARVEPHLVAITQPRSPSCEQFRSLRTHVLQAGEHRKMQAFVITSAGVAEGKTLTALNLAWLIAQTDGIRALLIDSDLRQPCAGDYFGIETTTGLSEVLAGDSSLEHSIIRLAPAGLYLLPGGTPRDDVAELLSGPRFGKVLDEARRMFDYIIIDAPPLGIFTDANVLINRADGALMVIRSGKTRYATVDSLLEQLPRDRMLGVVLNRAPEELDENSYYYQRRYYRPEGKESEKAEAISIFKREEVAPDS